MSWPDGEDGKHLHALHCREDRCCFGCDCPCHTGADMSLPGDDKPRLHPVAFALLAVLDDAHIDYGCAGTFEGDMLSSLCERLARGLREKLGTG